MSKLKFRADINALRAIAVIGVILYHFKVPFFEGGFSGVDIFFVISGYLMSKIIISNLQESKLSIIDFYGKRVKRIIPALLCMIAVTTAVGFFITLPEDFSFNSKSGFYSLLFISNMYYWKHSGYFDSSSEVNTFLHTWSLSVEWQFYIIYPILLLLLYKIVKNKKLFTTIFIVLTVLAIGLSFVVSRYDSLMSFYFFPTRAWEMMAGGVAFLIEPVANRIKLKKVYVLLSYLVLLGGIVLLSAKGWPGIYALIPVSATLAIIACNAEFAFIGSKPLQYVGKISYSLYLWHWPVYVFFRYLGAPLNFVNICLMLLISFALSLFSFNLIEAKKGQNNFRILAVTGVLGAIVITFSIIKPNQFLFKPEALYLSTFKKTHAAERRKQFDHGCCFLSVNNDGDKKFDFDKCIKLDPNKENYVLIGDSHAAQYSQSLKELFAKTNKHLIQATVTKCMPVIIKNGNETCYDVINNVYNVFLPKNKNAISGVLIGANWISFDGDKKSLVATLKKTIDHLKQQNIDVRIIGQNEVYTLPYPVIHAKEIQYNVNMLNRFTDTKAQEINKVLKENLKDYYIDVMRDESAVPGLSANNTPYMLDEDHYTKYGADLTLIKMLQSNTMKSFFNKKKPTVNTIAKVSLQ